MSDNHITKELKGQNMKTRFKRTVSLWNVVEGGAHMSLGVLPTNSKETDSISSIKKAIQAEADKGNPLYTKGIMRLLVQTSSDFSLVAKSPLYEIKDE